MKKLHDAFVPSSKAMSIFQSFWRGQCRFYAIRAIPDRLSKCRDPRGFWRNSKKPLPEGLASLLAGPFFCALQTVAIGSMSNSFYLATFIQSRESLLRKEDVATRGVSNSCETLFLWLGASLRQATFFCARFCYHVTTVNCGRRSPTAFDQSGCKKIWIE